MWGSPEPSILSVFTHFKLKQRALDLVWVQHDGPERASAIPAFPCGECAPNACQHSPLFLPVYCWSSKPNRPWNYISTLGNQVISPVLHTKTGSQTNRQIVILITSCDSVLLYLLVCLRVPVEGERGRVRPNKSGEKVQAIRGRFWKEKQEQDRVRPFKPQHPFDSVWAFQSDLFWATRWIRTR